jgi:hypothetical protein
MDCNFFSAVFKLGCFKQCEVFLLMLWNYGETHNDL